MKFLLKPIFLFFILLIGLFLSIVHILFGNCQTSKFHYIVQCYWKPKYLPLNMQSKNLLMNEEEKFVIICDNNFIGTWRIWHENGQLAYISQVKNGKVNGDAYSWFPNGRLESKSKYQNGKLEGLETWYFDNGQKAAERYYKNGSRDGIERTWHNNGVLESERFFDNGAINGKSLEWYSNGKLKEETQFLKGIEYGKRVSWYENGFLRLVSINENGISRKNEFYDKNTGKLSEICYYDENNNFVKKEIFVEGVLTKTEY